MAEDNDKPAGTWATATKIIHPDDEYIVGVWYVGFVGVAVYAELVRTDEDYELRIRTASHERTTTLATRCGGASEAALVSGSASRLAEVAKQAGMHWRMVTPLEYVPIGGDRLVCAEKLAGKAWARIKSQGTA